MNVLITAGNTQTPIDDVRCLTNIFTGRTGARIAAECVRRGHRATLLTSHPESVADPASMQIVPYRTFDHLHHRLAEIIPTGGFDVVVHAAAVSDYALVGLYADAAGNEPVPAVGKIKSTHPELWMRFAPTPKLVDRIRTHWGFRGILVKFKLEVGVSDEELVRIAHRSRAQSDADFLVANTLRGYEHEAFLVDRAEAVEHIERAELPARVLDRIETFYI